MDQYKFYEHDGAYFRSPADAAGVRDVLHGDQWVPYKGDTMEPVTFGNRIEDPLAQKDAA